MAEQGAARYAALMTGKFWIVIGGLAGAFAVAMAAAAAHALPARLDARAMDIVRSGIQMQGWHALALLATGLWAPRGGMLANCAGAAFTAGLVLFCGAVYLLALAGIGTGPAAPAGGLLLMLGWLLLSASALRRG
jgi:uncharacterized membrane protein YgdD (TMEM256/DUF423 family)